MSETAHSAELSPREATAESLPRDPENRPTATGDEEALRKKNHDKTLADSFPTSDSPSTILDPAGDV